MFIKFHLPLIFVQGGRKLNGADQQCTKGAKIKWAQFSITKEKVMYGLNQKYG